jgi:hypothetical protein
MEYKCRTIPLARLIIGSKGIMKPLCNECKSKDCENPIETISVSILGKEEKMRVWNSRSTTSMVVQCEGYNP